MLRFIVLVVIIFLAVIFFAGMFRKIMRVGLKSEKTDGGKKNEEKKKIVNARFEEIK